ncbi:hypothetical protein BDZ91DRAFT_44673 [Kalaharituber pfeilii]|nr:hypothetical protein BDZ91DRAFT_44673 [Kalaharituber pfeilii]
MNSRASGIPSGMVQSRVARYSYGVICNAPFKEGKHPPAKKYYCQYTRQWRCRNRMDWFIKKGRDLVDNEPISRPFIRISDDNDSDSDLIFDEQIYLCNSEYPPKDYDGSCMPRLCVYKADFRSTPKAANFSHDFTTAGKVYWNIRFQAVMLYRSRLEFSSEINGKAVGQTSVDYDHEMPTDVEFW